jgi:hypothetical protein
MGLNQGCHGEKTRSIRRAINITYPLALRSCMNVGLRDRCSFVFIICLLRPTLVNHSQRLQDILLIIRLMVVGLEVLTAVVVKSTIFRDITPCSPLKVSRRFGGKYLLNFQDWPWRWRRYVSPKRQLTFNGLHGFVSQTIVHFTFNSCSFTYFVHILSSFISSSFPLINGVLWTGLIWFRIGTSGGPL